MLFYIYGGSGSGKSAFAESLTVSLGSPRIYLATMQVDEGDREGQRRVERHRRQREGKGFQTLERERGIDLLSCREVLSHAQVLLEDLPNLLANEMFGEEPRLQRQEQQEGDGEGDTLCPSSCLAGRVLEEVLTLSCSCENLVVVGGDVFCDGQRFEGEMEEYLSALGEISRELSRQADQVFEVVYGIPLCKKGLKEF